MRSGADDAAFDCCGDSAGAGVDGQLGVDVRQVRLDGRLRHEELLGDLLVTQAARKQLEDLDLAFGDRARAGDGPPDQCGGCLLYTSRCV